MIARLSGTLIEANYTEMILDVHGVGYLIHIPMSTYDALPRIGEAVTIRTIMQVREDDISLYGFATEREKSIFELLIMVNGIGAKTALNILSSMNIPSFCTALAQGDVKALKRINGVGPKSAERMIVELKDKIDRIAPELAFGGNVSPEITADKHVEEALLALETLGFQRQKIQKTVAEVAAALSEKERTSENIIRKSLSSLNK